MKVEPVTAGVEAMILEVHDLLWVELCRGGGWGLSEISGKNIMNDSEGLR